jgi:hypothetical protein
MKNLFSAVILVVASMNAQATLLGTNVSCSIEPALLYACDNADATVVDDASEFMLQVFSFFNGFENRFELDLSNDAMRLDNIGNLFRANAGEILSLSIKSGLFDGVALGVTSGVTGVAASDLSFDGENLVFNFNDTVWDVDGYISMIFTNSNPVPNAPTALLMLLGLVGLNRFSRK